MKWMNTRMLRGLTHIGDDFFRSDLTHVCKQLPR